MSCSDNACINATTCNALKNMHYSDFTMVKGIRTSHVCWKTPNRWFLVDYGFIKAGSAVKSTVKAEHLAVIDMN